MSSQTIAREIKIDDKDANIKVVVHEDPSVHAEKIKDFTQSSVIVEGDFHVSVVLRT